MTKFKVLLVDDEEEFVRALAERLEIRGFMAEVALSGEEALSVLHDRPPDVMVLDLKMPGVDGMEVLRRAKKTRPDVQIVMVTGHGSEHDERTARKLGAFEYLQKPVDINILIETMNRAFEAKGT